MLYSYHAYPEKHISLSEKLALANFEEKNIDDRKLIIGSGGFGTVYINSFCAIKVAIKFSSQRKESENSGTERIKKEFFLTKTLRHPNILNVYGYIEYKGKIGYVMQYCNNESLNEAIKENFEFAYDEKIEILLKLSAAINYIHYKNFAHLDIKPQNIFLNGKCPMLGDFGLSTNLSKDKLSGAKLGCTIYYSPPEQIKNSPPSTSSDIWAFGMTMYQFLLKEHPFGFLKDYRKIEKDNFYTLIKHENVRPKIPEEFEEKHAVECKIMQKCWKLNPAKRPNAEFIFKTLASKKCNL